MPISLFRRLCSAMFDFTEKALEKFESDCTTLTAYEDAANKQSGVEVIKGNLEK